MQIVSLGRELLKTVGLLAVCVGLAKLRLKNSSKIRYFCSKNLVPIFRPKKLVFFTRCNPLLKMRGLHRTIQ